MHALDYKDAEIIPELFKQKTLKGVWQGAVYGFTSIKSIILVRITFHSIQNA